MVAIIDESVMNALICFPYDDRSRVEPRPCRIIYALARGSCISYRGLSAIRATAARHHFQALDLIADGFVEDGVGQKDQPVCAGVGVMVLTGFPRTEHARLYGVHSL
jgi:hypothetical protein